MTVVHPYPPIPLIDALSTMLPTAEQTCFLRACLHSGASARQAWQAWQLHMGGPVAVETEGLRRYKGFLPLLFVTLRDSGVSMHKTLQTYLRTAYIREELRSQAYRRICRDVLEALQQDKVSTIVLKGAALAETVYAHPALRHCHDLDILVPCGQMSRAVSVMRTLGLTVCPATNHAGADGFRLVHTSRLPVELHRRLFQIPYYRAPLTDLWARCQIHHVAGICARVLSPADALLHICAHAASSRSRESLRWVCDGWFLVQGCPDLDWDVLLDTVAHCRLVLPLAVTLRYLAHELRAPIPQAVLESLYAAASKTDALGRGAALLGIRAGSRGNVKSIVRAASGWRARVQMVQWLLFPTPSYFRWAYNVHRTWLLPMYYLYRPLRFLACRIGWRCFRIWRRGRQNRPLGIGLRV